ncbi:MAG: triacylglycerol lipase [Myxococcales bacterium]|jgi:triacylglycerol esterase/lipase EstA (alpha/beta hydrolase family)
MSAGPTHHVYLIPGLFGFARLGGYDYFEHLERAIAERFAAAGLPLRMEIVATPPTASISVRAGVVARTVSSTLRDPDSPVHLVGHSTGGLDSRLLVSPGRNLDLSPEQLAWTRQVRTLISVNAPHYGTPLAGYFTTVAGTRMLHALSLLTVASLTVGNLPLSAFSGLVAAVGAVDQAVRGENRLLEQLTDRLMAIIGEQGRDEIRVYMDHVRDDRGGIIQLMPEVMELFNAAVDDNPDVRYGCVATAAPPPRKRRVLRAIVSPISALGLAVYTTVHGVSSYDDPRYPYANPTAQQRRLLHLGLGREVSPGTVDGIVPTLSMLWGELLWCGAADHLDVVGHFRDGGLPRTHSDWLGSGAGFDRRDFGAMVDAITGFMLRP